MTRTTVVRFASAFDPKPVNVNDEIGLDPYASYTLAQDIEDLASSGKVLSSIEGNTFTFADGTTKILREVEQEIDERRLHPTTLALMRDYQAAIA